MEPHGHPPGFFPFGLPETSEVARPSACCPFRRWNAAWLQQVGWWGIPWFQGFVGGVSHDLWLVGGLVDINFIFPEMLGFEHHPNWRTHIFFRGVAQPPTRWGRGTIGTWCLNENEHNTLSVIYKVSTCFNHPFGGAGFLRKRIWWGVFSVMRSTPSGQGIANPNWRF